MLGLKRLAAFQRLLLHRFALGFVFLVFLRLLGSSCLPARFRGRSAELGGFAMGSLSRPSQPWPLLLRPFFGRPFAARLAAAKRFCFCFAVSSSWAGAR